MSKVKYPTKDEIKKQINLIIDESEMFEHEERSSGFVKCKPVKKSFFLSDVVTVSLAVAACVGLVVLVASYIPTFSSSQALKGSNTGITTGGTGSADNQAKEPATEKGEVNDAAQKEHQYRCTSDSKDYVSNTFRYELTAPVFMVDDVMINGINNYYTIRRNDRLLSINKRASEGVITPQNYGVFDNKVEFTGEVAGKMYSFTDTYKEIIGDSEYTYRYYDNFNVQTGSVMTFDDILKDRNQGIDYIVDYIYNETQQLVSLGNENVSDAYKTKEGIRKMLEENGSWVMLPYGLKICCNNYSVETVTSAMQEKVTTVYQSNTFVLTGDKLDILKDEYR